MPGRCTITVTMPWGWWAGLCWLKSIVICRRRQKGVSRVVGLARGKNVRRQNWGMLLLPECFL